MVSYLSILSAKQSKDGETIVTIALTALLKSSSQIKNSSPIQIPSYHPSTGLRMNLYPIYYFVATIIIHGDPPIGGES
jgi:hypothetical protein